MLELSWGWAVAGRHIIKYHHRNTHPVVFYFFSHTKNKCDKAGKYYLFSFSIVEESLVDMASGKSLNALILYAIQCSLLSVTKISFVQKYLLLVNHFVWLILKYYRRNSSIIALCQGFFEKQHSYKHRNCVSETSNVSIQKTTYYLPRDLLSYDDIVFLPLSFSKSSTNIVFILWLSAWQDEYSVLGHSK